MINVRSIVNSVSRNVNPNTEVTILRSLGYEMGAGRKQVPKYDYPVVGYAQVQALDNADLQHLIGLNMQGVYRSIYLSGPLHGVIRKEGDGGDLIKYDGQTWLVAKIIETWPTWTKAAICLQVD